MYFESYNLFFLGGFLQLAASLLLSFSSWAFRSLSLRRHAHGPLAKRLMHMAHLSGNTSGVSKSSSDWLNYTGFPGDVCVAFFNVVELTPHERRKPSCLQLWRQALIRINYMLDFQKYVKYLMFCGIESLKYVREFYTPICYCGDISTHRNVKLNETNCDWLFDMSVKWPHGRALANTTCHLFQTFSRQSEGLATRD